MSSNDQINWDGDWNPFSITICKTTKTLFQSPTNTLFSHSRPKFWSPHIELHNSFPKTYYMLPFLPIQLLAFEKFWLLSNNEANSDGDWNLVLVTIRKVTKTLFQSPSSFSWLWLYHVKLNENFPKTYYMPLFPNFVIINQIFQALPSKIWATTKFFQLLDQWPIFFEQL